MCVCVGDVQCPKGAMTEAQKGISPYIVPEIISSDLDESQESIFWCKKTDFRHTAEDWHPCRIHPRRVIR